MNKENNNNNCSKFFCNKDCEFFPCHPTDDPDNFNCLFCYCPLYALGDKCGGNFQYLGGICKDCSNCMIPHKPANYDYIIGKYDQIMDLASKDDAEDISDNSAASKDEVGLASKDEADKANDANKD